MRLLDRYICRTIISSTFVVILILMGIEALMEFMTQLSNIGKNNFGILQAILVVPMRLPTDLYQLFPMAGFLGCLVGLGRLASTSELTVMRTAGISITRIAWAVIKTALLMIVVVTIIGEWGAPLLMNKSNEIIQEALGENIGINDLKDVWLRHNQNFVRIGSIKSSAEMQNVMEYQFDNKRRLRGIVLANKGELRGHRWQLSGVRYTRFYNNHVVTQHLATLPFDIYLKPSVLLASRADVQQDSIYSLAKNIWVRRKAGLVTSFYEFTLWQRIVQPITTIIMICLGVPFIFGSLRSAGIGMRIVIGVIVGFAFYMMNQSFGPITMVYQFPPALAATLPTLVFVAVYLYLFRRAT